MSGLPPKADRSLRLGAMHISPRRPLPSNGHIVSVTGQETMGIAIMLWPLRVMGLPIVVALACAVAHTARAEPRPADRCGRAAFRAIIDVGHTEQAPGATSARGVPEFAFNVNLARRIEQQLLAAGFRRSVLLITEGPSGKGLVER